MTARCGSSTKFGRRVGALPRRVSIASWRTAKPCRARTAVSDSSSAAPSCPMPPNDGPWQADGRPAVKPLAQYGWRRVLWQVTRINVGPSPDELYEFGLNSRIRRTAPDAYQIGVIGLKGG